MWHVATQMSDDVPTPICLLREHYWLEDLGFRPIDSVTTPTPGARDLGIAANALGLLTSRNLTVVMPLSHMLLEVSK